MNIDIKHDEDFLQEKLSEAIEDGGICNADIFVVAMEYYHHMMSWRSFDDEPEHMQWVEILCDKSGHIHTVKYLRERTKETDIGWRPALPLPVTAFPNKTPSSPKQQ